MASPSGTNAGKTQYGSILHPVLRDVDPTSLSAFLRKRQEYLRVVEDHRTAGLDVKAISLKSSIDADLLASMVGESQFDGVEQVEELTDEHVRQWMKAMTAEGPEAVDPEEMEAAVLSSVRLRDNIGSSKLRSMQLFLDYRTFLRAQNWEALITTDTKVAVGHICKLLRPPTLRASVERALKSTEKSLNERWDDFRKFVTDRIIEWDRFFPVQHEALTRQTRRQRDETLRRGNERPKKDGLRERQTGRSTHRSSKKFASRSYRDALFAQGSKEEGSLVEPPDPKTVEASEKKRGKMTRSLSRPQEAKKKIITSQKASSETDLPACLNFSKCKGRHLLKDCPVSTASEKEALLKEYHEQKAARSSLSMLTFSAPQPTALPEGRLRGKLADEIDVVINGDYGADHSAISEEHLAKCATAGIFVPSLTLSPPISMGLAISKSETGSEVTVKADRKVRLDTTLDTPAGPLRLRNVEYLVFKESMPEVLLSRPMLQRMGFDLAEHLAIVRDTFHDVDFSHIGFHAHPATPTSDRPPLVPSRLASLLLNRSGNPRWNVRSLYLTSAPPFMSSDARRESLVSAAMPLKPKPSTSAPLLGLREPEISAKITPPSSSQTPAKFAVPNTPSPLFFGDGPDDDPLRGHFEWSTGDEDAATTAGHLQEKVHGARKNGMSEEGSHALEALLKEYADIFRTKLGSDPPADVPPMKIELLAGAKPFCAKVRRYSPPQAAFIRRKTDELLRLGLIRRNNTSQWACAPLLVPKDGPEQFRLTIDLRPVNRQTVPSSWPMPQIDAALAQLANDKCFANIDLCHGYWQMPLAQESQECQSFITPDGVFTPTRVLHGQTNAVFFFQSTLSELCLSLRDVILQWLDDLLFHCRDEYHLLHSLREFFRICRASRIKLHAKKCEFFLKEVHWCGRVISAEGVKMDPRNLRALLDMPAPANGAQLQQFVCAANWMRSTIPEFNKRLEPLTALLEEVLNKAGARKKRKAAKIKLTGTLWTAEHQQTFDIVKKSLAHSVTLAHVDARKLLCLFTDASDSHWASVLTQIPSGDLTKPFDRQAHEPLAFLAGTFRGSQARWSTPEKEAYAIVASVDRLDYLLLRPEGFLLFTDHKNLTYIFDPARTNPRMAKHVVNKIQRWALLLASYRYEVVHISGEENIWADLMSRWGSPMSPTSLSLLRRAMSTLFKAPLAPYLDEDLEWPTAEEVAKIQKAAVETGEKRPEALEERNGLWTNKTGAVWIPADALDMQLRLCIIGHCGRGGHRGVDTTIKQIGDYFFWQSMQADIKSFCNTCLHCEATVGGLRKPRPFAQTTHADRPNELLHFDYLYMDESVTGEKYIFIMKDDASSFVWLKPSEAPDAENAVKALLDWFASFGVVSCWCSDRGAHFKNRLIGLINRRL